MEKYKYLIVPFITLFVCQFIKFTIESIKCKKIKLGRFFNGTGGMPSTHTSFAFSLVFMIAFNIGVTSLEFAVTLVFAIIVAFDSMGVRLESGLQAEAINMLLDEVFESKDGLKRLKESLGHKPLEVLVGLILAFVITLITNNLLF